jgi:hypothetical protein
VPGHPNPVSNVTAPTFVLSDSEALSTLTLACEWTGPGNTGITTDCTGGLGIGATATNGDGTYTLAVTATDGAGNTNSARFSYELDTTPPRAPTVSSSVDTNQRTVTFQVGGLEANSTFTCVVTGTDVTAVTSPDCAGGSVSSGVGTRQSNGTYTVPVTVTLGGSVPDGVYVLSVTPTDDADNSGSAGTATYQLDTIAPPAPLVNVATASPSRNTQPLWSWQYAHNTTTEDAADQATCTITDPQGALTQTPCPTPTVVTKSPVLGDGGDGLYTFTVTVTDPAGNTGTSTDAYDFEHTAPDAPSIYIVSPAASSGRSAHPVWAVVGPAGASLTCELHDGMSKTDPVIAGPEPCSGTVTFDLTGKLDGGYTASVKASGSSSIAGWTYVLAPKAPRVSPPTSKGTPAVWTVTGNPADQFFCTLTKGTSFISGPGPCDAHPSYDMRHLPRGTYTLIVLQEGPENVTGANGSASWFWDGVSTSSPTTPVAPSGPNPTGPVTHPKKPKLPKPVGDLFKGLLGKGPHGISQVVKPQALTKLPTPSGLGDSGLGGGLAKGLRGAVSAITTAGGGTGFPLILLALVIAFLIAQNRIDRRDPKLAFASAAADDMVDFSPPPSRRDSL